jgi:hypothetical protein
MFHLRRASVRAFSAASRWTFSPAPLTASFTGEILLGATNLLNYEDYALSMEGPLKAAAGAAQPCTPTPCEAYDDNDNKEGVYTYHVGDTELGHMLVARTAFGDGIFQDSAGRAYGVDGGAVAVLSGTLVSPALRIVTQLGALTPFALGHLVPLPAGAVTATARGGRFEFAQGGEKPLLVLDTGDGGSEGGEEFGEEVAQKALLGEAAGVPAPELLREMQARPTDTALALSVCKVLGFRAGCANDDPGGEGEAEALRAMARQVVEAGGVQLLRLALEGHHRDEEVAAFACGTLEALAKAGAGGFAAQVAPLIPTLAAVLAAHTTGRAVEAALRAVEATLEDDSLLPAAVAAGLPALVVARLRGNLHDERASIFAVFALQRMHEALEGTDAVPAIKEGMAAWPDTLGAIGERLLMVLELWREIATRPKKKGGKQQSVKTTPK